MNVKNVWEEYCPKSHIHKECKIFDNRHLQNKKFRPTTSSPGPLGTDEPWFGSRSVNPFVFFLFAVALFVCTERVSAQEYEPAHATAQEAEPVDGQQLSGEQPTADSTYGRNIFRPLQIGDAIPDELWEMSLQVVNHPEGKETITLADYKDKLIIIDFWATWCVPCIRSLQKLDTLQGQFADDIAIIPTTYEDGDKAAAFFGKKRWSLPTAVNETALKDYFPYRSIPHQVWMKNGKVEAIVGPEYASADYIAKVLEGTNVDFNHKIEVAFDAQKPLFLDGNGGDGSNMLYQSVISGRLNARVGGSARPAPNQILAYNQTVEQLYTSAIGDFISPLFRENYIKKYISYEIDDSLKAKINLSVILSEKDDMKREQWASENLYCYNLVLPEDKGFSDVNARMFADLNDFFCSHHNLQVSYETREREVLALVYKKAKGKPNISTKGGKQAQEYRDRDKKILTIQNDQVLFLIHYLNSALKSTDRPIVDETGIDGNIDIEIDLSGNDIQSIRNGLSGYGLDLVEKISPVKMIVFANCKRPNPITE